MNRPAPLRAPLAALLLALGLAALPASAQTTPTDSTALPADPVAADSVEAAIEPDPERARELYDRGRAQLQAGSYDEAVLTFEEALLYNESYAAAALGRGQALAQLGRLDDSRTALESAVAMAQASDASTAGQVAGSARRYLEQINAAIEARQQAEAQAQASQQQQATADKVAQASTLLSQGYPVEEAAATEAYTLLEQARLEGYDPDLAAYFYAVALNAMQRGADAVPYAETALAATEGQADRSAAYVQLGLAHMIAGNDAEARAAFEAAEGGGWAGWGEHYLRLMDAEASAEG